MGNLKPKPNKPIKSNTSSTVSKKMELLSIRERRSLLPPPSEIEEYERVKPGITQFYQDYITKEQDNRIKEKRTAQKLLLRGQWFAILVALSYVGIIVFAIHKELQIVASVLGASGFVAIISLFLYTSRKKNSNADTQQNSHVQN